MLKVAFGEQIMLRRQHLPWFCKFKNRMVSVGNAKHLGHPPISNTHENAHQVKEFLFKNYKKTQGGDNFEVG
jgi:hypothetical protein